MPNLRPYTCSHLRRMIELSRKSLWISYSTIDAGSCSRMSSFEAFLCGAKFRTSLNLFFFSMMLILSSYSSSS